MTFSAVHHFAGTDPWDHLAREEVWLESLPPGASVLLLYVNSPCVVLGKHQNPLREVRLDEAARRGIPLVRRSSGGGTVWHDEGNLNWSILMPRGQYDRTTISAAVGTAVGSLGLEVTAGPQGDLFLGDKKVSGSAYWFLRDRVLHHGTLLCRARLDDLHGVLGPTGTLVDWVGVASRPMPVANLGVDVDAAMAALKAHLCPGIPWDDGVGDQGFEVRVADRCEKLKDREWLWDQTPPFTWEGETGRGFLRARVKEGRIQEAWDADAQFLSNLQGNPFFVPELFAYIPREGV